MRLPNSNGAIVELSKISNYLLSALHVRGRDKARFFISIGFTAQEPEKLRRALLMHATENEVVNLQKSEHGMKYTVQGLLLAPDGRATVVRSVWIIDHGGHLPRFVTAFPGPK